MIGGDQIECDADGDGRMGEMEFVGGIFYGGGGDCWGWFDGKRGRWDGRLLGLNVFAVVEILNLRFNMNYVFIYTEL